MENKNFNQDNLETNSPEFNFPLELLERQAELSSENRAEIEELRENTKNEHRNELGGIYDKAEKSEKMVSQLEQNTSNFEKFEDSVYWDDYGGNLSANFNSAYFSPRDENRYISQEALQSMNGERKSVKNVIEVDFTERAKMVEKSIKALFKGVENVV